MSTHKIILNWSWMKERDFDILEKYEPISLLFLSIPSDKNYDISEVQFNINKMIESSDYLSHWKITFQHNAFEKYFIFQNNFKKENELLSEYSPLLLLFVQEMENEDGSIEKLFHPKTDELDELFSEILNSKYMDEWIVTFEKVNNGENQHE